jgi:nitrate/TMAO reductase-like tetraheme cytochrome c subunit
MVLIFSFLIIGLLSAYTIKESSKPEFCINCHEMSDDYGAWASSSHKNVDCYACHVGKGTLNVAYQKIATFRQVVLHIFDSFNYPINADSRVSKEMPSRNCVDCHKTLAKTNHDSISLNHKKHSNINCAYCHNRVTHNVRYGYPDRLRMKFCVECHMTKGKLTKCGTCHIPKPSNKPASHYTDSWVFGHVRQSSAKCTKGCHTVKYCIDCHVDSSYVPVTHRNTTWALTHMVSANVDCTPRCHDKYFCSGCHIYRSNNAKR